MMTTEPRTDRPVVKLFNGRYTIESTATSDHRTFWVRRQDDKDEFAPGKRIVYLLTGPKNDDLDSYTPFAFVDDDGIHVWHSKAQRSKLWAIYADMLWTLALDGAFSPWATKQGYRILVEGACVRCNRVLTEPTSIRTGIGPICAELGF
jgi:hypothetical protein